MVPLCVRCRCRCGINAFVAIALTAMSCVEVAIGGLYLMKLDDNGAGVRDVIFWEDTEGDTIVAG